MRASAVAALLALGLLGCDMFDPELYRKAQRAKLTADTCVEGEVPVLEPNGEIVVLRLDELYDDWQVPNCGSQRALGNEGFVAVDLDAGQKLHVHVNAIDAIDPVVYVVDSCDERVCQPLHAASHCSTAKEHLSFLAPHAGRYYVGVDSVDPGGGLVELLAVTPACGDGEKQHSEACEDGDQERGDGCDDHCRFELDASDRPELEPNDDLTSGNVLNVTSSSFRVRGRVEGVCDPEVFSFDVPVARRATFRVVDGLRGGCIAPGPGTALQLTLHRGLFELARAVPDASGCVALAGIDLQARGESGAAPAADATYHVQLRALPFDETVPVEYALEIELE